MLHFTKDLISPIILLFTFQKDSRNLFSTPPFMKNEIMPCNICGNKINDYFTEANRTTFLLIKSAYQLMTVLAGTLHCINTT